jgi:hypothetical protein
MGRGEGGAPWVTRLPLVVPCPRFCLSSGFSLFIPKVLSVFLFLFFSWPSPPVPPYVLFLLSFFLFFFVPLSSLFSLRLFFFLVFLPQSFVSSSSVSWVFSPSLQSTFDFSVLLCLYRARRVGNGRYAEGRPLLRRP